MRYHLSDLMRYHSSSLMRYHSSSLMRYRSSDLMRYRSSDLMRYSSSDLTRRRLSHLMRSRLARVKFDESLSSDLMSRSRQSIRHLKKIRLRQSNINDEMIKHDHENEFTEIFLQEKNLKSHFSITSHISRQDATNQVTSIFATSRIFREKRL
jgi:hypothetical protein